MLEKEKNTFKNAPNARVRPLTNIFDLDLNIPVNNFERFHIKLTIHTYTYSNKHTLIQN